MGPSSLTGTYVILTLPCFCPVLVSECLQIRDGFHRHHPGWLLCSTLDHHPKYLLHDQAHAAGQVLAEHEEQLFDVHQLFSFKSEQLLPAWLGPSRPMDWSTFHVRPHVGPQKQPSACAPGHSSQMELVETNQPAYLASDRSDCQGGAGFSTPLPPDISTESQVPA